MLLNGFGSEAVIGLALAKHLRSHGETGVMLWCASHTTTHTHNALYI